MADMGLNDHDIAASMRNYRSQSDSSDMSDPFKDATIHTMETPKLERSDSLEELEPCQFTRSLTLGSSSSANTESDFGATQPGVFPKDGSTPPECVVCNDKATGYHYGVFTCEGCKGFFKRTVQKQLEYTCKGGSDCDVNQLSRNRCQYCRFQKCVEGGMLKHAVREDRTPGGRHRHASLQDHKQKKQKVFTQTSHDPSENGVSASPPSDTVDSDDVEPQLDDSDFMEIIEQLRHDIDMVPERPSGSEILKPADGIDVNKLMKYAYQELYEVIQWGKRVPGFRELSLEDQITLLKSSFMDLNVFRLAYRSIPCDPNSVMFARDIICNREQCMEMGWNKELTEAALEFCNKQRNLNLDLNEFSCLSGLVLLSPDVPGVVNKEHITELQTRITSCLRDYVTSRHPTKGNRLGKLLLCLPSLRAFSEKALENYVTMEFFGKLDMPPLVAELLE